MNRWWFNGVKFRVLKKWSMRPNQDGKTFTWKGWD